jgi:hypothetical protein
MLFEDANLSSVELVWIEYHVAESICYIPPMLEKICEISIFL